MADYYTQFSEILDNLTPEEEKWLTEQLASDPSTGSPVFLQDYEEHDPDSPDCGFQIGFEGEGNERHMWIYSDDWGEPGRAAHLVQKFLKRFRPDQCWSFTYSSTCSKPRIGEFGGGGVFVTADEIHWQNSHEFVGQQRAAFEATRATT